MSSAKIDRTLSVNRRLGTLGLRAGETVKGFAVVARDVRELVKRAARAAKDIKGLIAHSVTTDAIGARLVQATPATARPLPSPAIAPMGRLANSFSSKTAAVPLASGSSENWEEF